MASTIFDESIKSVFDFLEEHPSAVISCEREKRSRKKLLVSVYDRERAKGVVYPWPRKKGESYYNLMTFMWLMIDKL